MQLGLFMQPIHDPSRSVTDMFDEDRQAAILADRLGFEELWVGEHYSSSIECIVNPLQFFASLLDATKTIKFATGVLALPMRHPAMVACDVAQFDHLSKGRFIMGIGPGATPTDAEMFGTEGKNRGEMLVESLDMIHKIWASDPPYNFKGKYWHVKVADSTIPELGFGPMLKPFQKPYPPIALSVLSPNSTSARIAGQNGWSLISANFSQACWVKSHWEQYLIGCDKGGKRPDRESWRVARSILVADSDSEARDYLADERNSYSWYYNFMVEDTRHFKQMGALKKTLQMADDAVTVDYCLDTMVMSGSPRTVLDKLVEFVDFVGGPFGKLLYGFKEWHRPDVHQKSMRLLAEDVMPKLRNYCSTKMAAD